MTARTSVDMSILMRVIIYGFVAAASVLRYLPYPRFRKVRQSRPPEPTHRPNPRVRSNYGSASLRTEAQEVSQMKRAVGYCENTDCEDYAKGVFLLNHGENFYCPRCRNRGTVEAERGFQVGTTDIFKEVRVEFNYDPINGKYREIGIVRDESLWGRCNVYTLQSPLIKTEKRALKVAEAILANLNRYRGMLKEGEVPKTHEVLLSFDDSLEDFSRKLAGLQKEWEGSALAEKQARRHHESQEASP
jgi:hypothetical protein